MGDNLVGLTASGQSELLGKLQARWDNIMDQILIQIENQEDADFAQAVLHARVWPWRAPLLNITETFFRLMLINFVFD